MLSLAQASGGGGGAGSIGLGGGALPPPPHPVVDINARRAMDMILLLSGLIVAMQLDGWKNLSMCFSPLLLRAEISDYERTARFFFYEIYA